MSNEFDAAVTSVLDQENAQSARAGFLGAVDTNPEAYAEAQRVARRVGVPTDVALSMPKEVQKQAAMGAINFDTLAQTSPATATLLSDTDKAKLAHDDVPGLQAVERTFLESITEPVQRGYAQGKRGMALMFRSMGFFDGLDKQRAAVAKANGVEYDPTMNSAVYLSQLQRNVEKFPVPDDIQEGMGAISQAPDFATAFDIALYNKRAVGETILQSLGTSAPALAMTAAGSVVGPAGTAAGAGLGSFATEYGSTLQDVMTDQGIDPTNPTEVYYALNDPATMDAARSKAFKRGVPVGMFDALTAGVAGKLLAGAKPTISSVAPRAAGELGIQAAGGAAGEAAAQGLTDEWKPGDVLMEALAELPTGLVEVPGNYRDSMAKAQASEQQRQTLETLTQLSAASKVAQRDADTFEEFVQHASENGPVEQVFIDANALLQSGVAEQVAEVSPSVKSQLPVAAQTGGQIAIPVGEYAAHIAPTDFAQPLMDHLKTDPEGFSRIEAQAFLQNHEEELRQEIERSLGNAMQDDAFKQSADRLKERFQTELDALGHHTPDVNKAYSTLLGDYFAVNAAKLGMTPEELHDQYSTRFASEMQDGYGQFAGPNAETADLYSLARAKELLDAKRSPEGVRRETGWFKGADNRWRFEISDDEAAFKNKGLADPEELKQRFGHEFEVTQDEKNATLYRAVFRNGSPDHLAAFGRDPSEAIDNLVTHLARRLNQGVFDIKSVKHGDRFSLQNILQHPKLFAAYPHLRALIVDFTGDADYRGAYHPESDAITLSIGRTEQETLSTLLHEIQHAIQEREGFARGGNTDSNFISSIKDTLSKMGNRAEQKALAWEWDNKDKVDRAEQAAKMARWGLMFESAQNLIRYSNMDKPSSVKRLILRELEWRYHQSEFHHNEVADKISRDLYRIPKSHKMRERNAFLSNLAFNGAQMLLDAIPDDVRQQFKNDPRKLKSMIAALRRESDKAHKAIKPMQELKFEARQAKELSDSHRFSGPFDIYQSIAGEAEARNTQARQNLTEEERRNASIGSTMDVKPENLIVTMNGRDIDVPNVLYQSNASKARGSFNPDTLTISLLKDADLSTFLHESGHFFLEMQFDLASKLQKETDIFGFDSLRTGEQEILRDTQTLLDWFGVPDLITWYALDIEQKRSFHEQFARGFEAYLFEGKAPSIELQSLFQKFRAWLVRVYKSIEALDVQLTDEVRGVLDRMIASEEQIDLAQQARSMMPLFASLDKAPMSPEEFEQYQARHREATDDAVEALQARTLREMQWLQNARSRELKRLQKQHDELRRAVRAEIRMEVLAMPVYRAWTLLTGKITDQDRLPPNAPPKSNSDHVDPSVDSLFAAIGKLGGLNKEELFSTWGVDPAHKPHSGVFGKPVWRVEGGRSLDGMLEVLAEHGYLPTDAHGKADMRDFEEAFDQELRGIPFYSAEHDYGHLVDSRAGDQVANPSALTAARLDLGELYAMELPDQVVDLIKARRMTANNGLHPDIVADLTGFSSGDELARALANAQPPKEVIEALTDVRMLEQHGELATPQALEKAADLAIHSDVRARMVAIEANALAKATGQFKILASAAKELAATTISRKKVRDVNPGQFTYAEARAAKSAAQYLKANDLANAAAEKRNQLFNLYAAKAAMEAKDFVEKALKYLKKFDGDVKGLDVDYADQIAGLLSRFDLRKISNKEVDRRIALAKWMEAQRAAGIEPDIPEALQNEAYSKSYKELTIEEFRGLVDSVKQIEHLGRLKKTLLTAKDRRAFEAVRDEIAASIDDHSQGRKADTRTPTTNTGRALKNMKAFAWAHAKVGTLARILDGGKDGGPVWNYLIQPANERGDMETTMRAEATKALSVIVEPIKALGKMGGNGRFFESVGRSFNRESRIAIALNTGNQGNLQRLLGGEGWTVQQLRPILESLTAAEWQAVQAIWDHFESYRPLIAAKERRVYGKEPNWVEPTPFTIQSADGQQVDLRGGYYPIKYDPAASQRAEEHADAEAAKRELQGAYTSATTRRSFTKTRSEAVIGRPLLYTLGGLYSGVNDVIHDLAWHEWLIDANRLLKSNRIDVAIRSHYGPDVKAQFKSWVSDIAEGEKGLDHATDIALSRLRQGVSASGLGFNLMSALMQPTGFTQSVSRVGARWVGLGVNKYLSKPIETTKAVNELSEFMRNRARTRFRELNELRNQVQDQTAFNEAMGRYAYFLMMRCQQMVDVPTWWGAYQKALAAEFEDDKAIALADQAVIDSQGSGMTKDLSAVERGGQAQRLFTVFYSYMNTALNLGIDKTLSAPMGKRKAKLAAEYALLYVVPAVLGLAIKDALTPSGDDDDDYFEKLPKRLIANQIDYLMGLMVIVREFSEAAKLLAGAEDHKQDYQGPAGLRVIVDTGKFAYQASQGEFDTAFRKETVNLLGGLFGLPAAQVNRTWTGIEALSAGETDSSAAVAFGFKAQR